MFSVCIGDLPDYYQEAYLLRWAAMKIGEEKRSTRTRADCICSNFICNLTITTLAHLLLVKQVLPVSSNLQDELTEILEKGVKKKPIFISF